MRVLSFKELGYIWLIAEVKN